MKSLCFRPTVCLALPLLLALSNRSMAQAVPPTECDKLAASDTDLQKVGPGINLLKINSALAIPACLEAVKQYPDAPRLVFQTGRAYQNAKEFEKAMEFYKRAADSGYSQSITAVGTLFANGLGVQRNEQLAAVWYRKAADQGNALGQAYLGQAFKGGKGVIQDSAEAFRWFKMSADQGNFIGQMELAKCYYEGSGVAQNDTEAAMWARKSSDQGYAPAQLYLGYLAEKGRGTPQNLAEAVRLYKASAEQGNAYAQNNLGNMYSAGFGVIKNEKEALKWYRMAADSGNPKGQFEVGRIYEMGRGVRSDPTEAVRWYRLAAEQGNANGQAGLAQMYDSGKGVPKNIYEAVKWLKLAAAQGNAFAQNNLGAMYGRGEGLPQDYAEAVKWYALSAAQGNAVAQANLGKSYTFGSGVPQDFVLGHMWLNLAAAQGNDIAKKLRDALVTKMRPEQVEKAQRMARLCQASQLRDCGDGGGDGSKDDRTPTGSKADRTGTDSSASSAKSSGSGFFVSPDGYVITNEHVVKSCRKLVATDNSGDRYPLRIVRMSNSDDLALLKSDSRRDSFARIRDSGRINQGEAIALYGFPLSGLLASSGNVSTGVVTALAGIKDNDRQLQISAPVQPGNSGGPLVDMRGNVVGVVVAKLNAIAVANVTDDIPQNINFAIKASSVTNLLDLGSVSYQSSAQTEELNLETLTKKIRQFTVFIECY